MPLLTLDEAKAQLNITTDTNDAELTAYIEAIGPVIEAITGPVDQRQVVEVQDVPRDGARAMVLRQTPALSLTSVEPLLTGGIVYAVDSLVLDGSTGVVRLANGKWLRGPLRVTYQAGLPEIPATINLAARILLQHLWRTQNGTTRGLAGGSDDYSVSEPTPGYGYAIPNRVLELLEPYRLPPMVA